MFLDLAGTLLHAVERLFNLLLTLGVNHTADFLKLGRAPLSGELQLADSFGNFFHLRGFIGKVEHRIIGQSLYLIQHILLGAFSRALELSCFFGLGLECRRLECLESRRVFG